MARAVENGGLQVVAVGMRGVDAWMLTMHNRMVMFLG
jgi:hypothetical protein